MPNPNDKPNPLLATLLTGVRPRNTILDAILEPRANPAATLPTVTKSSNVPADAARKSSSTGTASSTPGSAATTVPLQDVQKRTLNFRPQKTPENTATTGAASPVQNDADSVTTSTGSALTLDLNRFMADPLSSTTDATPSEPQAAIPGASATSPRSSGGSTAAPKKRKRHAKRKPPRNRLLDPKLTTRGTPRKNKIPRVRTGNRFADFVPERLTGPMVIAWRHSCGLSKAQAGRLLGVARGSYTEFEREGTAMKRTVLAMRAIHAKLHLHRLHYYETEGRLGASSDPQPE